MSLLKFYPHLKADNRQKDSNNRITDVRMRHYAESRTTEKLLVDLTTIFEETNDEEKIRNILDNRLEAHARNCKRCQTSKTCYRFDEIQAIAEILFL